MRLEEWVAVVTLAALMAYALLGGADFGGGIWDLLARGPRAAEQREAIAHAMGPVWEANHVWLIFQIVLLFSCFPAAFAALSIGFYVPFHLVLLGVVLRGAAFVFRSHSVRKYRGSRWSRLFGIASSATPLVLGMCLGAISTGEFRVVAGGVSPGTALAWLAPYCWGVGILALTVCAYVAAVYLTLETEGEVRESFRRRALVTGAVMTAVALLVLGLAWQGAPRFFWALFQPRSAPLFLAAAGMAAVSAWSVWARRFPAAMVRLGRE